MSKLQNKRTTQDKINIILKEQLPSFASSFFRSNKYTLAEGTLYAYALDLALFFQYLEAYTNTSAKNMTLRDFEALSVADIEHYLDYASKLPNKFYPDENSSSATIKRKYASLSLFFLLLICVYFVSIFTL